MPIASANPATPGDILLEAGTNELEVLVFMLAGGTFGVNVAKVREVIRPVTVTQAPRMHASVRGMFNIRGSVMPLVDLKRHLAMDEPGVKTDADEGRIIIMEFNGRRTGFLVDAVEQIHRMSWQRVKPAPRLGAVAGPGGAEAVTGMIELDERLVQMLDFESVADAIALQEKLHTGPVPNDLGIDRASHRVILAEDSPFMRELIRKALTESGYERLEVYANGEDAWTALQRPGPKVSAVVSDIEMPRMDGLRLSKLIKESASFRGVPVVLFSSLISDDNRKKGEQVGVDVQIPKPELAEMVRLVDRAVSGRLAEVRKAA